MTVERAAMVEFWPLVDVAKLELRPGDTVIVRSPRIVENPYLRRHFVRLWQSQFPGIGHLFDDGTTELIVKRPMPEMRAEDLVQPERKGTME
jgi:hypothetical protein